MWMKVEKVARGLDEPDGSRGDGRAIEIVIEVEFEGSPGTTGELAQKLPVVAEEDPQALGHREDHLAVGNILEQLLVGPVRPQELALLVAAWTQTPKLAREGDEELMPAVQASHSGDAVVEHAAIEIAVDGWLDAAAQVAVLFLEVLLVDEQEAFEVLRRS